jgi:GNAT superfamily N-acetyltransferase
MHKSLLAKEKRSMLIRKAGQEDAIGISKVQVDTWKTTYRGIVPSEYLEAMTYESREQKWKEILKAGTVYVAEDDERIVGFSCGGKERSGKYPEYQGELYAIYILQEYQRKGLGRSLLHPIIKDLLKQQIYKMLVIVLEKNPSRFFYESLGAGVIDTLETEFTGEKIPEKVYGWQDIRKID